MKFKANAPKQVSDRETAAILEVAKNVTATGDFVELGCYRGDTSVALAKILPPSRKLYLYDSFAGLPPRTPEDGSAAGTEFKEGKLLVSKREVVEKFKRAGLKVPFIKKAFFEGLTKADLPDQIAFAFLDGDLYSSIRTSLRLVEPKMTAKSVILVHDYNNPQLPGVSRAVDAWLRTRDYHKRQIETLLILEKP